MTTSHVKKSNALERVLVQGTKLETALGARIHASEVKAAGAKLDGSELSGDEIKKLNNLCTSFRVQQNHINADSAPSTALMAPQRDRVVYSTQLINASTPSADTLARNYFEWIQRFFLGFVATKVDANESGTLTSFKIGLGLFGFLLFTLVHGVDDSIALPINDTNSHDVRSFNLSGGVLARPTRNPQSKILSAGRLTFTKHDEDNSSVSLYRFQPSLPWWFYKVTQAKAHAWVMDIFRKQLEETNS